MTTEPVAHTIAVGLGSLGCEIASELRRMVREDGSEDTFHFLGIYSEERWKGGMEEKPDVDTVVNLEKPGIDDQGVDYFLDQDLAESLSDGEGNERSIGRAYVDSEENFVDIYTTLREVIEEAVERYELNLDEETPPYNIWTINSLGGAIGSGSFPVIGAIFDHLIRDIVPGIDRDEARIMGLGSLPWSETDMEKSIPDEEVASSQVNAYTSLMDVEVLTESEENLGIEIRSASAHAEGVPRKLNGSGVFDGYFIQPAERDEVGENPEFTDQLYRSAAVLPLCVSKMSRGVAESTFGENENSMYSFKSLELKGPQEDIRKYVELDWDDDEREVLKERLNDFRVRENRRIPLPVRNPDEKLEEFEENEEKRQELGTLKSLLEEDVLKEEDALEARDHALRRLLEEEPLMDLDSGGEHRINEKYVGLMGNKDNIEALKGVGEGKEYNLAKKPYDEVIEVYIEDEVSTWIIAVYREPDLDSVSEYRRISERYVDEERDLTGLFSSSSESEIIDEDVTGRFAYPEFYAEDEAIKNRIRKKFGS